jgi:hypothetical protein
MASSINSDNGVVSGSSGLKSTADATGVLALQTNGTTAVTVDTSQNVGVGTTTPAAKLVVGSGNTLLGHNTLDNYGGNVDIRSAYQVRAANTPTQLFVANSAGSQTIDTGGAIDFGGYTDSLSRAYTYARIQGLANAGSGYGGYLSLMVTNAGGAVTERFRVGTAGQLGIGGATYGTSGQVLTSGGASAAPTWTTVSGGGSPGGSNTQIQFNNSGAFGGASGLTWNGSLLTANSVVSTLGSYDTGISVLTAAGGAYRKWNFIFTPGLLSYVFILSTDYEDSVVCLKNYGSATITFLSGNITGRFIATSSLAVNSIMVFSSAASYAVSVVGGASLAPNVKFTALNCAVASYNREY